MSYPKSLSDWQDEIHAWAKGKGWWETDRNFPEQLALMHSELSEALEDWRAGHGLNEVYYEVTVHEDGAETRKPCGIPTELADCVIRIFDTCAAYGVDVEAVIREKMAYNQTRPYKHGNKRG